MKRKTKAADSVGGTGLAPGPRPLPVAAVLPRAGGGGEERELSSSDKRPLGPERRGYGVTGQRGEGGETGGHALHKGTS